MHSESAQSGQRLRRRKSMRVGVLLGLGMGLGLALMLRRRRRAEAPLAVDALGLEALAGEWYELAHGPESGPDRLGTRLQAGPDAEGRLQLSGTWHPERLDVPARHFAISLERARPGDASGRFRLLGLDIWLLAIDPEAGFVLAGSPDRRRLWLLGRAPELPKSDWDKVRERVRAQGYEPDSLIRVPHHPNPSAAEVVASPSGESSPSPPASNSPASNSEA